MSMADADTDEQADRLYEQYGKPLEVDHWGKFIAIAPDGRTVMGASMLEAAQAAQATLGPGVFLFKIGPRVVGRLR
jgi:hypothetical protein